MYLGATRLGRTLHVHRALGDADVVIPVGPLRSADSLSYLGAHGSWFPRFASTETQLQLQTSNVSARDVSAGGMRGQNRRREEAEEAARLLGVTFVVQLLPGPTGSIVAAFCGEPQEVARRGSEALQNYWSFEIDQPADLVVAALDNTPAEQSWRHVAEALSTALLCVTDGGSIVLWTELDERPGPALKSLGTIDPNDEVQRLSILKHRWADETSSWVISEALEKCRVYFRSQLDDVTVEELGLAPLHNEQEIQPLDRTEYRYDRDRIGAADGSAPEAAGGDG